MLIFIKMILYNILKAFKNLLRFSITFKITFVYAVIFTLLLFTTSAFILLGFRIFLIEETYKDIEKNHAMAVNYLKETTDKIPGDKIDALSQQEDIDITIFDAHKQAVYTTITNIKMVQFYSSSNRSTAIYQSHASFIFLNRPVSFQNNEFYVQISKSFLRENVYMKILFTVLMIANGVGVIITLIIGSSVSRKMLRPIAEMTNTVKAITIHHLDTRLDVGTSQDELKELAETFNEMINHIQKSYERQNQFVSDASHELRTPISVIQGYANLLDRWGKDNREVLEESISAIKSEAENMKDLTEKLLYLARIDKQLLTLEKEAFSINAFLDEVVKETILIDSKHKIIRETKEDQRIYADRKALKQALRIFIDNSVKFTPDGGLIRLSAIPSKKELILTIEDTGIGIPEEDIPHIFNRFYRADKSRTKKSGGHGLGLSIAKWIIDKHNGTIKVESKLHVGTKMSIYLPYQ